MMAVLVKIPSPLRRFTEGKSEVEVNGQTVEEALENLIGQFSELAPQLYDEKRELRNFVNLYVRGEDIRYLDAMATKIKDGDEVMIIPSIAGGGETLSNMAEVAATFDRDEYLRYSRHFSLPEIGLGGQLKLKKASVLIIGAGGLGNPASIYLAAVGVGHIGLVDYDVVDLSNLQRQILYTSDDIGKPKLTIAKKRLQALNPKVEINTYEEPLSSANAMTLFRDYDIILDGTDNFPTRYLVNDVCVFQGKPNVYGSIFRFDGQISLFDAKEGPCYRCLYEEPPPPGLVPSCAEGGVLGVLPSVVGSLQATETIKWITGAGQTLIGRLLLFDALAMTFREVKLQKNPDCVVCGENPTITEPIDYEGFCGVSGLEEMVTVPELSVQKVKQKLDSGENHLILDVREKWEWDIAHIKEALFIPMNAIPSRLDELDPSREIVVHCKEGPRAIAMAEYLIKQGFPDVKNMTGGIKKWTIEVDPSLNLY